MIIIIFDEACLNLHNALYRLIGKLLIERCSVSFL